MQRAILAAACLCVATSASAAPQHVTGQAITDLVAGATVEIDTPLGTRMPVRFAADGTMSGEARDLALYLGPTTDSGRWWVANDQLCSQWSRWFDGETHCLRLKLEGSRIHWRRQDGTTGTATLAGKTEVAQAYATPLPPRKRVIDPPATAPERLPAAKGQEPTAAAAKASAIVAQKQVPAEEVRVVNRAQPKAAAPDLRANLLPPPPDPAPMELEPDALNSAGGLVMAVANVARSDVLNVRLGPSADKPIVGGIAPNERNVIVMGPCREQWCPVRHRDLEGWVNSHYLAGESLAALGDRHMIAPLRNHRDMRDQRSPRSMRNEGPRDCLSSSARELLGRIEERFGPVKVISTCRPGATIAGSGRHSRHASGNAVDFNAGDRKAEIVNWLVATHRTGGTMTYADMEHIHVDIGPHFVSIAGTRMARRERSN